MKKIQTYKYIILGAGPAGLTFANRLLESGEDSFLIVEKEIEAGGLCRSKQVDGSPLDIGGGHILDVKKENVLNFLFKFMPKTEWDEYDRISTIKLEKNEIDYPFESNIWQFPIEIQLQYLLSISETVSDQNKKMPKKFVEWIYWKLGEKIATDYMIPYNEKIWSIDLNKLGTYWLYKLPDVSLSDTILSCLQKKPSGNMPAHAKFLYPKKYGYGEVWKRMAEKLNGKILYETQVKTIDHKNRIVNDTYQASKIIVTVPWKELNFSHNIPKSIQTAIDTLEYSSIRVTYYDKNEDTKAHWTYIPDKSVPHHRVLYRSNFCPGSRGYWTEMNEKRAGLLKEKSNWHHTNKYAYPLNTIEKPKAIGKILDYFSKKSIYGLGRWGEWEHMNSDVVVDRSLAFADKLIDQK